MGDFDAAQICLNGHVTNMAMKAHPAQNSPHCSHCGAETISECPACEKPIKGSYCYYRRQVLIVNPMMRFPAFCDSCGAPFPWTSSKLDAVRELIEELELDIPEKTLLTESIEELVKNTPKARAAAVRFQRLTEEAKPMVKEGFKTLLVEVVSKAAKKMLGW
jgi:hypothetical protein